MPLLNMLAQGKREASLANQIRKTRKQIKHRFRQKLISMSVGRVTLGSRGKGSMPMCWASGFRGLQSKPITLGFLKTLDRHRERQIARVSRRLESLPAPSTGNAEVKTKDVLKFYGTPFSYWGQFGEKD
jgi:hypothetical protein